MTIVKEILHQMPAVGTPQAQFLETLCATLLALRGRVNCRTLSRSCDYGERTMARPCRRCFDWPDCPQRVSTVARDPRSEGISAQAAACSPQSGTQTFGLGPFFNGCPSRADRGLAISTLAVVEVTRRCAFTRAVAQPPPGDDATVSPQAKEETRGDFDRQQLREQRHRLPPQVTSHGVDGSFTKKQYLEEVVRLDRHPLPTLRCDADGRCLSTGPPPKRRGARRKYDGKVDVQDLRRVESLGTLAEVAPLHLYPALVWHGTRNRKRCRVVVSNRKAPAQPRSIVLASTALALDGRKLVEW
jgi:hypothetical protein